MAIPRFLGFPGIPKDFKGFLRFPGISKISRECWDFERFPESSGIREISGISKISREFQRFLGFLSDVFTDFARFFQSFLRVPGIPQRILKDFYDF